MILADSSVWIDFLRVRATPQVDRLRSLLGNPQVVVADLVLVEVLQGTRSERDFEQAHRALTALRVVPIVDPAIALQAAVNYRLLRAKGITVRKTIDTLIATRCIADDIALLYSDRDFDAFAEHLGLRSALAA